METINNLIDTYIEEPSLKEAIKKIVFPFDINVDEKKELLAMIDVLIERRKTGSLYRTKRIDELIYASAFIYDLYVYENAISSLLLLREKTAPIFEQLEVQDNIRDYIYEICEGYQGEDTKIVQFIPQKGSPHDLFADAIFITNLLKKSR